MDATAAPQCHLAAHRKAALPVSIKLELLSVSRHDFLDCSSQVSFICSLNDTSPKRVYTSLMSIKIIIKIILFFICICRRRGCEEVEIFLACELHEPFSPRQTSPSVTVTQDT